MKVTEVVDQNTIPLSRLKGAYEFTLEEAPHRSFIVVTWYIHGQRNGTLLLSGIPWKNLTDRDPCEMVEVKFTEEDLYKDFES